jgi:hypothetical protein
LNEDLCGSEITEHENTGSGVEKEVLRLDISMTDADGVDIGQGSKKLLISLLESAGWNQLTWYMYSLTWSIGMTCLSFE